MTFLSSFSNNQVQTSNIPEEVVHNFPLEKVRENGPLLAPGIQCRVCLRAYQVGQFVRKLPRCKHKVPDMLIMEMSHPMRKHVFNKTQTGSS